MQNLEITNSSNSSNTYSNLFIPNKEQLSCITRVNDFLLLHKPFSKLLINGSAGTGKTTILITSIVNMILLNSSINSNSNSNSKYEKKFIITAPTNKAKDVLLSKYNTYLNSIKNNITEQQQAACNDINFLTVAQLLSINKIINELGEETFSKGNDKKIAHNLRIWRNKQTLSVKHSPKR